MNMSTVTGIGRLASMDPAEGVKLYGTSHLGQHEDNYWVLSEEVHNYSALEISL